MKLRLSLVLMGMWLAGSIIVSVVAAENFFTIDRLIAGSSNASFHALVDRLGRPQARDLLRYLSSELNRLYFELWNWAQLVIGVVVVGLLARESSARKARLGAAAMLGVVVLMMLWLTPQITTLGRGLDFVPREPAPPGMRPFWLLHGAYTLLELGKLALGVVVTIWISRAEPQARQPSAVSGQQSAGGP